MTQSPHHQVEHETTKSSPMVASRALTSSQIQPLIQLLEAQLPYSIPLLRRIQFHVHQPVSPTARIFIAATLPPEQRGTAWDVERWLSSPQPATVNDQPWLAAHVDLSYTGQTQVWLFASWEASPAYPLPSSLSDSMASLTAITAQPELELHKQLFAQLFRYISEDLIPLVQTTPSAEWLLLERSGKYLSKPYARQKVLFGTVGEKVWGLFPREARTRTDEGYWKFLFRVPTRSSGAGDGDGEGEGDGTGGVPFTALPAGFHFAGMRDEHLQAVLDRTPVPRTLATLRQLVSVGLFHESSATPIGWGFRGKDASLSSLHTEPEYRGKGLAVALGGELLRREHAGVSAEGSGEAGSEQEVNGARAHGGPTSKGGSFTWAHADVNKSNTASLRVMEKLGGKPMWMVMWTEVDMRELLLALQ